MRGVPRRSVVAGVCLLLATLAVPVAGPALGQDQSSGQVDQQPAGPRECTKENFPGTVSASLRPMRQSFVPSRAVLSAVELCITTALGSPLPAFKLRLYEGDDPTDPGQQVGEAVSVRLRSQGTRFETVDLPDLPTEAGGSYVLEVAPLQTTFRWRASAAGTDRYPNGTTNQAEHLGPDADFGFRTYAPAADLTGSVDEAPAILCPGLDLTAQLALTVTNDDINTNDDTTDVGPFAAQAYLSSDDQLDDGDLLLEGSRKEFAGLAAGTSETYTPATAVPLDAVAGRGFVLLRVDVDDDVVEADEANNVAAAATTVTGCGDAVVEGLSLATDEPSVGAGLRELPFADIPPSAIEAGTSLEAAPLHTTPLHTTPLHTTPLHTTPLHTTPLHTTPLHTTPLHTTPLHTTDAAGLLDQIPRSVLEGFPLAAIPKSPPTWEELLDTQRPIQDLTLADLLDQDPPLDLRLADVDLTTVLGLTMVSVVLSGTPLDGLGLGCDFLAEHGFDCAQHGIDPGVDTLVSLDALGFPMAQVPATTTTLADTHLAEHTPLATARLTGDRRYRVGSSAFGPLRLSLLSDPDSVADCAQVDCDADTLAAAEALGALRDVPVATLIASLPTEGLQRVSVAGAVLGMFPYGHLPWGRFAPDVLDVPELTACPPVTYHLTGTSSGTADDGEPVDLVDPSATVTLPPGFHYAGGASLSLDDGGPAPVADPTVTRDAEGRRVLAFSLDALITGSFDLAFQACAGTTLGVVTADATISGADTAPSNDPWSFSTAGAPVEVEQRDEVDGPDAGTATPPTPIDADTLYVGHVGSHDDLDWYTIAVDPDVPPGTVLRVHLQPPSGHDDDLIAFGPEVAPLHTTPLHTTPLHTTPLHTTSVEPVDDSQVVGDDGTASAPPESLQAVPLHTTPLHTTGVRAVSINRDDRPEVVDLTTTPGEEGVYTLQVSGFNGDHAAEHYALWYEVLTPELHELLATCQAPPRPFVGVAGAPPSTVPTDPTVLFLVNQRALGATHGPSAAATAIDDVRRLAARDDVRGIVLDVESDSGVADAYGTWESDWCNVLAAQEVATAVRGLVTTYRQQHPTITNVQIVGDHTIIPMLPVADGTALGPAREYLGAILKATGGNNALTAAFAANTFLTDAGYGTSAPRPWRDTAVQVPDVGVARVVGPPSTISEQVVQYELSGGTLGRGTAALSGYDFLSDGVTAAADVLEDEGVAVDRTLIRDDWTAADLRELTERSSAISRLDMHANHFLGLSAEGSRTGNEGDVVDADLVQDVPTGGMVLSIGCNFGVNVPDVLGDPFDPDQDRRRADWIDALADRQAVALGNTSFGYGDSATTALGERLLLDVTRGLFHTDTISQALAQAQQRYFETMGAYGQHDAKAMQTLTLYGWGFYRLDGAQSDPDPEPTEPEPDPLTGLPAIPVHSGPHAVVSPGGCSDGTCLVRRTTERGTIYDLEGTHGEPLAVNGRPVIPQTTQTFDVPNKRAGGFWFTAMSSEDQVGTDPVFARATMSRSGHEPEPQLPDVSWPVTPAQATSLGDRTSVTLPLGAFRGTGVDDGAVVGDLRLNTAIDGQLYLRDRSAEGFRPTIRRVQSASVGTGMGIMVDAEDHESDLVRGAALLRLASGQWEYLELQPHGQGGEITFSGGLPDLGGDEVCEAIIQVLDAAGNVGYWTNKGTCLDLRDTASQGLTVSLPEPDGQGGWYLGPVSIEVTPENDGVVMAAFADGDEIDRFSGTHQFVGTGLHHLVVRGSDGSFAVVVVAIDQTDPAVTIVTPEGGATYTAGTSLAADYACADRGSGIASCTAQLQRADDPAMTVADGDMITLDTIGTHRFAVQARDVAGRPAFEEITFTVASRYEFSGFGDPVDDPPALNDARAGETVPVKFELFLADGTEVTDPGVVDDVFWQPFASCSDLTPTGPTTIAMSNPGLRHDGSTFIFNAQTEKKWKGTCRRLVLALDDGLELQAYFQFR